MKRKIKINNLIEQDILYIAGRDWVSNAMHLYKYENELALITIDDPTDFEIEIEVNKNDKDIMLRVIQKFYIPLEFILTLEKYITHITLHRIADPVY